MTRSPQTVTILGVSITNLSAAALLERIRDFLNDGKQHHIVTVNPEFLVTARRDLEFRSILQTADLATDDGVGLQYAAWLQGKRLHRHTGVWLTEQLCDLAAKEKQPVFFLGAEPGVADRAAKKITYQIPELAVAGATDGGIVELNQPNQKLIDQINAASPAILFVAFSYPKGQKWIAQNIATLPSVKIAIGIGGALDFISGNVSRAPHWLQRLGLEWLYRLGRQPWRWRRILQAVVVFPLFVIAERLHLYRPHHA